MVVSPDWHCHLLALTLALQSYRLKRRDMSLMPGKDHRLGIQASSASSRSIQDPLNCNILCRNLSSLLGLVKRCLGGMLIIRLSLKP